VTCGLGVNLVENDVFVHGSRVQMDLIVQNFAANTGTQGHRKYNEQVDIYISLV
jgi:hypothetical protein